MKSRALEPGLLSTFRLLVGMRLGLVVLGSAGQIIWQGWSQTATYSLVINLLDVLALFAFLSWEGLEKRLKAAYLPLVIILATVGPIMTQQLMFLHTPVPIDRDALVGAWQLLPILFIPLVIISWQYGFRSVLLFCLGTVLLDSVPIFFILNTSPIPHLRFPLFGTTFIRTAIFLLVGYMIVKLMDGQRAQRNALHQANERLTQYAGTLEQLTISRERNRLARELHDVVAHTLSGVAVELEGVKALWNNEPIQAQTMLDQCLNTVRSGLTETRRALQALRATPLEDLGLALAVRSLAESAANRSGFALEVNIADNLGEIPPDVEQCVYRVAAEALANITEHAGAKHVTLQLVRDQGLLRLTINDDGRGFNLEETDMTQKFGLKGMQERAEMVGGEFQVKSQAGKGTTILFSCGRLQ